MKLVGVELKGDRKIGKQVVMNLDNIGEFIEIPLVPDKEEKEELINPDDVIRARMEEVWEK